MAATSRPTLTLYSISDIADVATTAATATLSNINTVSAARLNSQITQIPQRSIYFQTQIEGIGANFQWTVFEILVSTKDRGLR